MNRALIVEFKTCRSRIVASRAGPSSASRLPGRLRRDHPEPSRGHAYQLGRQRHDRADQRPEQDVAPEHRVAEPAGQEARPRHHALRPVAPDQRLERHVEQPGDPGGEGRIAERLDEDVPLVTERGHVIGAQHPHGQAAEEHREGEAERPAPVAAAQPDVAPRRVDRRDQAEDHEADVQERADPNPGRHPFQLHAVRPRPRMDDLEVDRRPVVGGGLDPHRKVGLARIGPLPGRLAVGVGRRIPFRRDGRERGRVEAGLVEQELPVGLGPGSGFFDLRRDAAEQDQSPVRVHLDRCHARDRRRRVGIAHDAAAVERLQLARAGPVDQRHRRRTARGESVPLPRRGVLFSHVVQVLVVGSEEVGLVHRGVGVAELAHHVAGALDQDFRALAEGDPADQLIGALDENQRSERQREQSQSSPGKTPAQSTFRAGGGDHLGRGDLARGQRRCQRVSSGKRRRDREGRRGPQPWVALETALDRPFDGGIDLRDDAGDARRAALGLHLP